MSTVCNFPTCTRRSESTGWCIFHAIYSNSVAVKKSKPVKKESDSMKDIKRELRKMYPVYLAKHPLCAMKLSPQCTKIATCIHHVHGRLKENILNQKTWVSACETCNNYAESHHAEAAKKGLKKSKFTTVK